MNFDFSVFSTETLSVVRVGNCHQNDISIQARQNELVFDGWFDPSLFYLKDGEPSEYSASQLAEKAIQPSDYAFWSNLSMTWEDCRSVDQLKDQKWAQVKADRDDHEFGPFSWNGYVFDGDEAAQRRINLAVMGAQAAIIAGDVGWSVDWTLADNSSINLSASDMIAVANALGANIAQAHAAARAKRQQIEQATTKEELDAL